jgi:RNA polymerase sigma factor (sigma-70 family)
MSDNASRPALIAATREKAELLARWSKQYRKPLLQFFQRRLPSGADREDLVQDVFLRIAAREDLEQIVRPDSYLFHAAANVLTDWRRKQLTHAATRHDELDAGLPDVGLSPERVLIGRDVLKHLIASLKALPPRTRAMFMLYHFECLTHREIAGRMGVAVRTVEDHMARANAHVVGAISEIR